MKKMLIVANGLNVEGGIGNCLLNMLTEIVNSKHEVHIDLLLNDFGSGKAAENLKNVLVLPIQYTIDLNCSSKQVLRNILYSNQKREYVFLLIGRLLYKFGYHIPLVNISASVMKELEGEYDIAIAYNVIPNAITNYVAYKVKAEHKIAWAHMDISQDFVDSYGKNSSLKMKDLAAYKSCLHEFDQIYAVSTGVMQSIKKEISETIPIQVFLNFTDKNKVIRRAKDFRLDKLDDRIILLTVGRLSFEKGIDRILQVAKLLAERGYEFKWYLVGEIQEELYVERFLESNNLKSYFELTGIQKNPYPYFALCDIYVQCSNVEGYCTTTNEARMLGKPVITTDVAGAEEQFIDGLNGYIVEKNALAVFDAIVKLIDNNELRDSFGKQNARLDFNNEESRRMLDKLLS